MNPLTDIAVPIAPSVRERNLNAYYFSLKSTGMDAVDSILEAVAGAGKAYHCTSDWNEGDDGSTPVDIIQAAADAAAAAFLSSLKGEAEGWRPIEEADRSIATVQTFGGVELRNSYPVWVRDDDGRIYEAVWSDYKGGHWWDLDGEDVADPVEFYPHPLAPARSSSEASS